MSRSSPARKGAPGILDVAARAGVSGATVSRAFTRPETVRPDTRERVMVAARALGYIRDRLASGMQSRRSGSVGLVVPTIDNAIFAELIEAFSHRLGELDRTMLIASHDYDDVREVAIVRSLLERRVEGVALIGRYHDPAVLEMLRLRELPGVTLWGDGGVPGLPSIGANNREAGRMAMAHLLELGHRDIAMLFPDTEHNDRAADRLLGAEDALRSAGVTLPSRRRLHCPYDMAVAKSLAMELLLPPRGRPTAIVAGNDVIAFGTLHAARRLDIAVPAALSIVGIGDFRGSSEIEPGLTTVRLPARRIGRLAADALVGQIGGLGSPCDTATRDTVLACQLMHRSSSAPA